MEAVTTIQGKMAALPRANVDTDQIIPKQFLKRVERSGFGPFLFWDWARDEEGEIDPGFVLNKPEYQDAVVLVTGPNFGSGSSREHAPWSLEDWGFRAIVAPSFADIFRSNCHKIGLLPVVLTENEVARLTEIAADPTNEVTIDLETQTVAASDFKATFDIDPFVKHCLTNGLDDVALTLGHEEAIAGYERRRPEFKPTLAATVIESTRQEQARAILGGRGPAMARTILGRRPVGSADFQAAFDTEWIDIIAEIPSPEALLALGANRAGPRDGLYVLEEGDGFRVYHQERGIAMDERRGMSFDAARTEAVRRLLMLGGLPFVPPGMP